MTDLFTPDDVRAADALAFGGIALDELPLTWPKEGLRPHRFAGIFRLLVGDERTSFDESIRTKGQQQKIIIFQDAILDGRNRYLSQLDAGVIDAASDWRGYQDLFAEFQGNEQQALDLVWMLNEERRHDSAGERAMAAGRYKKFVEQLGTKKSNAELARDHGVSERLLDSANAVLDHAEPELKTAVDEGRVSVTDAADASKLSRETQVEVARAPDRKAAKRKVQAAKAPDLPAPLSRTDLALFGEAVTNLAHEAADKHGGAGASISADKLLKFARDFGLIQASGTFGYTRSMLLALNKLRDFEPARPKKDKPREPDMLGPIAPPLGAEWSQKVGGFKGKYDNASMAVFHEEDDTFSISMDYQTANCGGSSPYHGSYPIFHEAIGAVAGRLVNDFRAIAEQKDARVTSEVERKSANAAADWIESRLQEWGIDMPISEALLEGGDKILKDPAIEAELFYQQLVDAQVEHKGHHTKATAEPLLRAGRAAEIEWQRIADDVGHPLGTVQGWSFKLGMTGKGSGRAAARSRKTEQAAA